MTNLAALTTAEAFAVDRMNSHAFKYQLGQRIKELGVFMETLDTAAELTGVLCTGFVSGAGTVAATDTILQAINKLDGNQIAAAVATVITGKAITGFVSGAGTVGATDTILQAINKLDGNQIAAAVATVITGKAITGFVSGAGTLSATDTILSALNKLDGNVLAITGSTASLVGAVASAPASGTIAVTIERWGKFFSLTFTLTAARVPVTDGAGAGSYGVLKLFDFVEGSVAFLGCRQNFTAYAEGAALTGAAGDAAFVIGLGSTAIAAAADGVLAAANRNIGGSITQTLSGGTTTGTLTDQIAGVQDGTATAADIYLNWSGTAATIDANSTIDVTGTISIVGCFLGDD